MPPDTCPTAGRANRCASREERGQRAIGCSPLQRFATGGHNNHTCTFGDGAPAQNLGSGSHIFVAAIGTRPKIDHIYGNFADIAQIGDVIYKGGAY